MVATTNGHRAGVAVPDFLLPAAETVLRIDDGPFAGVVCWVAAHRSVGDILRWSLQEEDDSETARLVAVGSRLRTFSQVLRRWNLVQPVFDEDGARVGQEPVPPTVESLLAMPDDLAFALLNKYDEWLAEVSGVSVPLEIASSSGEPSEAPSETTEASSPSRRSSRRRKSSSK